MFHTPHFEYLPTALVAASILFIVILHTHGHDIYRHAVYLFGMLHDV